MQHELSQILMTHYIIERNPALQVSALGQPLLIAQKGRFKDNNNIVQKKKGADFCTFSTNKYLEPQIKL